MTKLVRRIALSLCALLTLAIGLQANAQNGPITIGGTLGLTGPFAGPAVEYKAVYDYWLAEVNKRGGLLGRQVKMTIYNDESTPTIAQSLPIPPAAARRAAALSFRGLC